MSCWRQEAGPVPESSRGVAGGWRGLQPGPAALLLPRAASAVLGVLCCFLLPWRFCTDGKLWLETLGYFGVILEDRAVPLQK